MLLLSFRLVFVVFVAQAYDIHGPVRRRRSHAPAGRRRSSPTSPRRRRSSWAYEIAKEANALFNSDHDGVMLRMLSPIDPKTPNNFAPVDKQFYGPTSLSFVLLNKYAWNGTAYQLFKDGERPAIIAKPSAKRDVACMYPCDGDSLDRHYSCHVQGCPCHASGSGDWCDVKLSGKLHKPCAFKNYESAKMMAAFRAVQEGKSPLLKNKACGFYHTTLGTSHNEVVFDPRTWDKYIKDMLWAFVLTDACTGACERDLRKIHAGYTAKHGDIPILSFNLRSHNPFHASSSVDAHDEDLGGANETEEALGSKVAASNGGKSSDVRDTAAATSKDEDEAATNIRVGQVSNVSTVLV